MKKTKIAAILLAATTLALSSCTIGGSKSSGKKKKSSSGSVTTVTSGSEGGSSSSGQPIVVVLQSITASGMQTTYYVGDTFVKPTVSATYSDGSTKNVTNSATFTGYNLSNTGTQTVTVSYSEDGVTKTTSYTITVKALAWDSTVVETMSSHLDGVVLPFAKGTWEWTDNGSSTELYGLCNDSTTATVTAIYQAATDWEYLGVDSYGDPLFAKTTQSEGTVTVNIYENSTYKVIVYASFAEKQERTTDTDWSAEYKEIMHYVLGGSEELPFYQFGENYEIASYGLLYLEFYDSFNQDLTTEYCAVVEEAGYTHLRDDDYGDPVYGKTTSEGTIELNIYYYSEYGNCVDVSFIPNKETSAMWPSFQELTDFEEAVGFEVPHFEAESYTYYSRYGNIFIETETTENLATAYSQAAEALGYIHIPSTSSSGDVTSGTVTNWEETFSLQYGVLTHQEEGATEEDDPVEVIDGFRLQFGLTEPESTFVETWPEEQISEYLAGFAIEGVTLPVLDDPLSKKFKVAVNAYDDVLAEYLELYAPYIEAGWIDLATVEGWAAEDSGFFITSYDKEGTGAATYNAKFDSTWENVTEEGATSTSWSKNGVTVVVSQGGYYTQVQILEPSEPEPLETVEVVFATADSDSSTSYTDANALEGIAQGADVFSSASDVAKVYKGKSGLKFSSSKDAGKLTLNFKESTYVESISFVTTAYGSDAGSLKVYVNGDDTNSVTLTKTDTKSLTINDEVTSITFEATKRIYLTSFTINPQ